jgi:hypothetical protein
LIARIKTIGTGIEKNCQDEDEAKDFVERNTSRIISIFANQNFEGVPFDNPVLGELSNDVHSAMVYKAGRVNMGLFHNTFWVQKFSDFKGQDCFKKALAFRSKI